MMDGMLISLVEAKAQARAIARLDVRGVIKKQIPAKSGKEALNKQVVHVIVKRE